MRPTDLGTITLLDLARAEAGVAEVKGAKHNPRIVGWLTRVGAWADKDEVPWCSAFVDEIAHRGGCCTSNSLRARSWLAVGEGVVAAKAQPGMDIVIFNRGGPHDASIIDAPGHVAFFVAHERSHEADAPGQLPDLMTVLGGNQGDKVCEAVYSSRDVLGVRRLHRI